MNTRKVKKKIIQPVKIVFYSGCIFSVLIVLTMVGNSLVIFAISTNKSLQRPCNFFLASLAIADLGVSHYIKYFLGGLVPFVATPLKERFVVFLKWLLIDFFRLG